MPWPRFAGERFRPAESPPPQVGQGSYWYRRLETAPQQPALLSALLPEPELRDEVAYSCDWWRRFSSAWPAERVAELPCAWLHSDFHGRNVAFAEADLVAWFDFDDVWFGPRICDVAQGVFNFGRQTRGIATPDGRRMRADHARAFLDAYQSVTPLTPQEVLALPSILKAAFPPNAFQLRSMDAQGMDFRRRFLRDVEITHQLDGEIDRVRWALIDPAGDRIAALPEGEE